VDLSILQKDPLEPVNDDAVGRMTFAAAYDPAFCESLIVRRSNPPDPRGGDTDRIHLDFGDGSPFWTDTARKLETRAHDEIRIATFDMLNSGRAQTVLEVNPMSGAYWGTFFMVHDGVATDDSLRGLLAAMDRNFYPEEIEQSAPAGWRLFQTSDDRFTDHRTFSLSGTTFVLAMPQYGDDRQAWTLFKPLPDGGMDTVCNFQVTGPNL
jgi:hypothetical protein